MSRHTISALLLAGLAYLLSACSNEVLIGEKDGKDTPADGKVMLAMTVRATPLSVSGGTDAGSDEERVIRSLYVFVFNIGASQYCEAKKFTVFDMDEADGKYTFKMEVTPGYKRFYLVANPGIDFRDDLAGYTQAELQDLRTMRLEEHRDGESSSGRVEDGLREDPIMSALREGRGVPMSMSVTGRITLDNTKSSGEDLPHGSLTLDDGSDTFSLIRAVAKVHLICRVKRELPTKNLGLEWLEIQGANKQTFLFPKYAMTEKKWGIDFPATADAAILTRTIGYVSGKIENTEGGWKEFDRGTHYLYENYFGPTLPGDTKEGLIDEAKYSWIHIVLDDGRDKTFPLPYLKRNDYLTVRISLGASDIICDIKPWEKEEIHPDYTDKTKGGGI